VPAPELRTDETESAVLVQPGDELPSGILDGLEAIDHQAGAPGFLISILPNDMFSGAGFEQAA
jgi:hypothetical protein